MSIKYYARSSWGRFAEWVALFVLLIVGTWLALPDWGEGRREPYWRSAGRTDLRNLASQQEIYFSDEYSYTTSSTDLAFTNSEGVIVSIESNEFGWAARATHVASGTGIGCAIFYGDPDTVMRAPGGGVPSVAEEVFCDPDPNQRPPSVRWRVRRAIATVARVVWRVVTPQ